MRWRNAFSWRAARQGATLLAVLLAAGAVLLSDPRWLHTLRHQVFDQYQRWQPRDWKDTAVRIIDVDEESLARVGQWPWPRTRMAELVDLARAGQAAAIGFDVAFSEPDRTSPGAMAQTWRLPASERAALDHLPDHDAVFAQALGTGRAVLGFTPLSAGPGVADAGAQGLPGRARFVLQGTAPAGQVPVFDGVGPLLPVLADAAAGHGAMVFVPDGDGVVRRLPLVARVADRLLPALAVEMLRVGQGQTNVLLRARTDGGGLAEVRVGRVALPVTASGELWIHYAPPAPSRAIPAWRLLAGQVPPEALQGRLLLVGSSAPGLMDLRFNPLGELIPGVQVHAQALEQALTLDFLVRPAWAVPAEALALLLGGLLVGVLALNAGPVLSALAALGLVTGYGAAGWWAFSSGRLLLDPLTPALGVLVAYVLLSLLRHHLSEKRRRWVSQAFSRYVSPNLVSHIVRHPEQLALSGERRTCSFIFTDLVGFTTLMESIDPAEAVGLLNRYLDGMIAIVFRHEGTLDRIIGDALAIMFSAPIPQADHRQRALDCALEMQRFAQVFTRVRQSRGLALGHTRIGVHCGEVIIGNFGGSTMFDYRALGDAVNTASRLEGANKYLGTRVCVSEDLLAGCSGARVRCMGRLVLKGKSRALRVFQPLRDGLDLPVDEVAVAAYDAAYALMAQQRPEALAAFEALAATDPDDGLVAVHLQRLRLGETGDLIVLDRK